GRRGFFMNDILSCRALLRGTAGLSVLGISPILLSLNAAAAETVDLTLPWIPEGEVAFMYAARKEGFWAKRGLQGKNHARIWLRRSPANVGIKRYEGRRACP